MNKSQKIVKQFGEALCREAYRIHMEGEGAWTVGDYLSIHDKNGGVNVRRADNIIDAGRWLVTGESFA
jgi:hypothetical protein